MKIIDCLVEWICLLIYAIIYPLLVLFDSTGLRFFWNKNISNTTSLTKREQYFYGFTMSWFQFGVTVWKIPQNDQKKVSRPL